MDNRSSARQIPVSLVAGLSALIVVAGGGTAWWAWQNQNANLPDQTANTINAPDVTTQSTGAPSTIAPQTETAQVYWLQDAGQSLALVTSPVSESANNTTDPLEAAIAQLLKGPAQSEAAIATTIPAGTQLRSLKVDATGIHVDVSEAFTEGGGSAAMTGRVAQILYTATSLDPSAKVWLSVEGKPLEVLGGEGLVLEQPLTRQSFERDFDL
jgi:spore germination protein GerM